MGLLSRGEREGWDYYLEGRGRGGTTIYRGEGGVGLLSRGEGRGGTTI